MIEPLLKIPVMHSYCVFYLHCRLDLAAAKYFHSPPANNKTYGTDIDRCTEPAAYDWRENRAMECTCGYLECSTHSCAELNRESVETTEPRLRVFSRDQFEDKYARLNVVRSVESELKKNLESLNTWCKSFRLLQKWPGIPSRRKVKIATKFGCSEPFSLQSSCPIGAPGVTSVYVSKCELVSGGVPC